MDTQPIDARYEAHAVASPYRAGPETAVQRTLAIIMINKDQDPQQAEQHSVHWTGMVRHFSSISMFRMARLTPSLVLLCAHQCRITDLQQEVRALSGQKLLVVYDRLGRDEAINLLRIGARGLVPYNAGSTTVRAAMDLVSEGQGFAPPELLVPLHGLNPGEMDAELHFSVREAEVAPLIAAGFTNKEIARQLGLQEVTIKVYASGVFRKLGVSNRTAATAKLLSRGIGYVA